MQTNLAEFIKDTPQGQDANSILRSCVHCGFCLATCPTYRLLGDELDGPRGRIYLIKELLEGRAVSRKTQRHLDRCLTCRACETTCPSGVNFSTLLDIGREMVDHKVSRPIHERIKRSMLSRIVPYPNRLRPLIQLARMFRPLLPKRITRLIRNKQVLHWPPARHPRKMLVLTGCVQSVVASDINKATANVLDRLGISLLQAQAAGCCGALDYHLVNNEQSLNFMRINIDAWWPYIENGVEAIVMTASGCGITVKDYAEILKNDPVYASKAIKISVMTKDLSEIVVNEDLSELKKARTGKIAFQIPCTLQHGQKCEHHVRTILEKTGFDMVPIKDAHLCCGSAGTYSILQPTIARQLREDKLNALLHHQPDMIVSANIGCMMHLQQATSTHVRHWIELLAK